MRARDLGLACGKLPTGPRNTIADVAGVRVGHATVVEGDVCTGVTAIVPHDGDIFRDKLVAAADVLNGFGKSIGLMQVEELGQLETPILLTNTFSVPACANALIRNALQTNPEIGRWTTTVNPVVCECNDGYLSDIQAMLVTPTDAFMALGSAEEEFANGAVGAGAGMSCFGFKGGIGSASRVVALDKVAHTLGVLVLANFGRVGDLRLPDGRAPDPASVQVPEAGSVIVVVATDVPVDHRQLRRVIRRAGVGLARCGSFWGHGSGDVFVGFTTGNRVPHAAKSDLLPQRVVAEPKLDLLFQAVAEATQEAVLDALAGADTTEGRAGHRRPGLRHALKED
ncbi:P1 family peptidase [Rhodovastum atsumiense]|uniref:P1 family peptidase n=1 Tax=Rhodovastum atsumiense TaxID=504468 RepID=A0A5M6IVH6_9PROT|nr:P1 family peptidase [Rhodovastum atsumiense]KAA5612306.1 P1 family peptidase [Rhodovastum atsumiense]CAH2601635.1 P1 family peptidase [Rhodovastum atsumiense]